MSFDEYLSLTASIISLWFEYSIVMCTEGLRHVFGKLNACKLFLCIKTKGFDKTHINLIKNFKINVFNKSIIKVYGKQKPRFDKVNTIS